MKVVLAAVADYANVSQEGKLNICGVFATLGAADVPVATAQMHVVVLVDSDASDAKREHELGIDLIDEDGTRLIHISGRVRPAVPPPGEMARGNHIFKLNNVVFQRFGKYEFKILLEGAPVASLPLRLVRLEPPPAL